VPAQAASDSAAMVDSATAADARRDKVRDIGILSGDPLGAMRRAGDEGKLLAPDDPRTPSG
jgi:hypothetical protein